MSFWEILLLAAAVSMDAFAVSLGEGMSARQVRFRDMLTVGLWFGGFQALMPLAGYLLGSRFASLVKQVDHWIAFGLLVLIGINMIREASGAKPEERKHTAGLYGFRTMLLLSVATSIDALAVGVSFAFLETSIWHSILTIGVTTFFFSAFGLLIGKRVGGRFHEGAALCGGIVLILIGLKILVEHLFL